MRAFICTQIGEEEFLEVQDLSPRPCGPTQLRIAVTADSANFPALVEGLGPRQTGHEEPLRETLSELLVAFVETSRRAEGRADGRSG